MIVLGGVTLEARLTNCPGYCLLKKISVAFFLFHDQSKPLQMK